MANDGQPIALPSRVNVESRNSVVARFHWECNLPPDLVERIWKDPDALLLGQTLQDKLRCSVARIDEPVGSFVWKRHTWGSPGRTIRRALTRSTAYKCWHDGRILCDAGIPTPRPRAYFERCYGPFKTASYLLTDYIPGTSLYRLMRFGRVAQQELASIFLQVVELWQRLGDLRIQHNDFKTENFIVDPQGKVWLIDLERMCWNQSPKRAHCKQLRELDDLLHPRNWRTNLGAGDWLRQLLRESPAGQRMLAKSEYCQHPLVRPVATPTSTQQLVSVVIPCKNAAGTIVDCLRSAYDVADEIIVADAGSTDGTLERVREFGSCRIVSWPSSDAAAFQAWIQAQVSHPWVFLLLPDEQLSPELAHTMQDVLALEPKEDAFAVNYRQSFRGRRLAYGGFRRKPVIRLFRKWAARFETHGGEVAARIDSQQVGKIRFAVERELCGNISNFLVGSIDDGRRAQCGARGEGESLPHGRFVRQAVGKFLKPVVLQFGWLDGWNGLHAHLILAINKYLQEVSRWESTIAVDTSAASESAADSRLQVYNPEESFSCPRTHKNLVRRELQELPQIVRAA